MAVWQKIKFYYHTLLGQTGATLTATSTASGDYSASYLYNALETNMWKALNTDSPCYITLDTGLGSVHKEADYLIMAGHNLGSASARIVLQHSNDGTTWLDAFTQEMLRNDKVYLKEFTSPGPKRYWRLNIADAKLIPQIAILAFGLKTELDYASASFDPHGEETVANVNLSYGGYVAGVHAKYTERDMTLRFDDCSENKGARRLADGTYTAGGTITADGGGTTTLYEKLRHWRTSVGVGQFFVAWERSNAPDDVFLMRSDARFANPLTHGGAYRDITIALRGRKE
jgi:hypothetical protein